MNNSDLDALLKKARLPERPEEFFETFPQQITNQLRHPGRQRLPVEPRWFPRLAWGLAAIVCVLLGFAITHWRGEMGTEARESNDVLQNAKFVRETLAMFPNQVCAIMNDQRGLNLIFSNHGDVPASPPIYVRICDGKSCLSCVTFSGQEIQIAGQKITVLSDAQGGIIIVGNNFAWSSSNSAYTKSELKIEANDLSLLAM
jgi:hypothetical protein